MIFRFSLLLLLSLGLNNQVLAQIEPNEEVSRSMQELHGWISIGTVVGDFERGSNYRTRVNANLFAGLYFTNWLSAGIGPGLRMNDGFYVFPFYGGLRLADRSKKVSPHLLLSGGFVTNPDLGSEQGSWCALTQAGLQFNGKRTGLTFFLAYENLPLYRKKFTTNFNFINEIKVTDRFQFLSVGLTVSF